jgi:hypothetical protein
MRWGHLQGGLCYSLWQDDKDIGLKRELMPSCGLLTFTMAKIDAYSLKRNLNHGNGLIFPTFIKF